MARFDLKRFELARFDLMKNDRSDLSGLTAKEKEMHTTQAMTPIFKLILALILFNPVAVLSQHLGLSLGKKSPQFFVHHQIKDFGIKKSGILNSSELLMARIEPNNNAKQGRVGASRRPAAQNDGSFQDYSCMRMPKN